MAAEFFGLDVIRPAVLTIDLHRGHLDPQVATLPLSPASAARVTAANVKFLHEARLRGVPVIHAVSAYRDLAEIHSNPFWKALDGTSATRANQRSHNMSGGPGVELMPGIFESGDRVVATKKRYDCFLATDLEFVLKKPGTNLLLITGVNSNSCVLTTTITASTRDYACIAISDCIDTMDGAEYHAMALGCIERAFGWVMTSAEALEAIA